MDQTEGSAERAGARSAGLSRLWASFTVHDFRWLWGNQFLLALASSMEMLAQGWLVLQLTDSAFWVGAAAGLRGLGHVGFSIFGGVIADRGDRRRSFALVQVIVGLSALLLGLLVVTDRASLTIVLAIVFFRGTTAGVILPLGNAIVYDAVGRGHLLNAIAARLAGFNVARIVGSLLAGALIATVGVGGCLLVIAGVALVAPTTLAFMRGTYRAAGASESPLKNAAEGLRYSWGSAELRRLLVMSALMEMFGFSYLVMLPVIARDVLEVGAAGLGLLSAANATGSVIGTVGVASLGDFRAKGLLLGTMAAGVGLTLVLFALSPWFALSLVLTGLVGLTLMSYDTTMATLIQLLCSDAMRGRVMGLYALTYGFTPLGGFVVGAVASAVSAPFAVGISGGAILAYALPMLRRLTRVQDAIDR